MNKIVVSLSGIIALRFLGLFIVLPLLSLYASSLHGADVRLVGIAMGSYAFTQMFFMYAFGKASDKYNRKTVIMVGLIMFLVGSIMCGLADDIYTLIAGRLLQGAGSIASVITALIADFTKEENRSKAYSIMGGSIALSFSASMLLGPILGAMLGVETLFFITALLALIAMIILYRFVPEPPILIHHFDHTARGIKELLKDKNLQKMNLMIFLHAAFMTLVFLSAPMELTKVFGWHINDLWKAYVPSLILGFLAMGPAAIFGEKYNKTKHVFLLSIALFGLGFLIMGNAETGNIFTLGMVIFFIGFSMQEPLLQSSVTKFAKSSERGGALGVFNTFQSIGAFIGGMGGGYCLHHFSFSMIGESVAVIALVWFTWTLRMTNPRKRAFLYLPLHKYEMTLLMEMLKELHGVIEYYINQNEKIVVIKYDESQLAKNDLYEKVRNVYQTTHPY